jgi:glycosyltransferase involved in cell wall biosynthesis
VNLNGQKNGTGDFLNQSGTDWHREGPPEQRPKPGGLPTFSIILETENLARVDTSALTHCLDTLARQEVSLARANEVFLMESGDAPPGLLNSLRSAYPWITIIHEIQSLGYFDAKMQGARRASGEVVVFCDSDCEYDPQWLKNLLISFRDDPEKQCVAGETSMEVTGPLSMAVQLIYGNFPPFTGKKEIFASRGYFANNVAFRKAFLLENPIPHDLPIYRGNCAVHAELLHRKGYIVWRQPQARCLHPLPTKTASEFIGRYLLHGHDHLVWSRYTRTGPLPGRIRGLFFDLLALVKIVVLRSGRPVRKLPAVLREDPRRIAFLPVSFAIVVASTILALTGAVLTLVSPEWIMKVGIRRFESRRREPEGVRTE